MAEDEDGGADGVDGLNGVAGLAADRARQHDRGRFAFFGALPTYPANGLTGRLLGRREEVRTVTPGRAV